MHLSELKSMSMKDLCHHAKVLRIENPSSLPKNELVYALLRARAASSGEIYASGVLEILSDSYGFLRSPDFNYRKSPEDVYVASAQIKKLGLREGDTVSGQIRPSKKEEHGSFSLLKVDEVNGVDIETSLQRPLFDNLTAIHPNRKIKLEYARDAYSNRVLDLICPIGFGQRCLIVAPPRTGKTVLLEEIARGIAANHPKAIIIALLIGERPEEVTEISRSIKGETSASTFDEPAQRHVDLAEMVLEKAKRQVECGRDVVILLDSITRLAKAYNTVIPPSGRTMTGGLDINALTKPKKFFGAGRNMEEGGSLTIIATALVDLGGSKAEDIIFEEFKGTGNAEIHLDRRLMEKRIFPCVNVRASGTRKDALLMDPVTYKKVDLMRREATNNDHNMEPIQVVLKALAQRPSNEDLLEILPTAEDLEDR